MAGYVHTVHQYEDEAVAQGYVSDLDSLRTLAQQMISKHWITMDDRGGLWLIARDGQSPKVGLSASTLP